MPAVKRGGSPPGTPAGNSPKRARRAATQAGGRLRTLTQRPRSSSSRTARAARARSVARSARRIAPATGMPGRPRKSWSRLGGRRRTATESRTNGKAACTLSRSGGSPATARWQVCPREAARCLGRCTARRSSSSRASAEAIRVGRGNRPPTSISNPAQPGFEPAQASAAAVAFEPLAAPTAVTRITRPLIRSAFSRRRRSLRQGGRRSATAAMAGAGAPSPLRRAR